MAVAMAGFTMNDSITKAVSRAFARANGYEPVPRAVHNLRHTFGEQAYQATKDIVLVQGWMGHESIETTRIYVEADEAVSARGARALAQRYGRIR